MDNAFTPTPVCSPARACLMTGRTASQHGIHDYLGGEPFINRDWLAGQATIAELLQARGYRTGLAGKWHLGRDPEPQHGFEDWFALAGDYPIDAQGPARYSRNGEIVTQAGSKAEIITDAALDFISRDDGRPFFLTVGHVSTHSAWAGHPKRFVAQYENCAFDDVPQDEDWPFGVQNLESRDLIDRSQSRAALAQYYAAVSSIDEGVGRVLDRLETLRLREDTLVIYTSDHGLNCGHHGIWGKGNGTLPLNMVEETIRVPLILSQPGTIDQDQRSALFVDHLDLFQTLRAAAGMREAMPELAGRSYLDAVSGDAAGDWRDIQFCEYGDVRMARDRRYKLIDRGDGPAQLFDLEADPRERRDIAADPACASILQRLGRRLSDYYSRYATPAHSGHRPGGPEPTNTTSPWVLEKGAG